MILKRLVDLRDDEHRAVWTSFGYFFFVLASYFILRPIRDEVAAASGVRNLPWMFAGTLVATLLLNPLFAALVVRFAPRRFIPFAYFFFVLNLLGFYLLMRFSDQTQGSATAIWTGRVFFVWTSVFNLFVVSIFWSFMADVFRSDQAKRLFGFIGVGGTLGSIAGSVLTASLAGLIGTVNLLLVSAALLGIAAFLVSRFPRAPGEPRSARNEPPIGGSIWAGLSHLIASPYLLVICLFLILYTIGSTFLYFQQTDIVGRFYETRDARTAILARIELAVQVLTVVTQVFLTGRVIRWIGLAAALALLPALSVLGFTALGIGPVFATVAAFSVIRRGANFALTNPAMEILFTVVPREDKYKAKSFIETFVYRGGDQIGAWSYAGLVAIGLGSTGIAFAAVPLALVWLFCGVWLGREHGRRATASGGPSDPGSPR